MAGMRRDGTLAGPTRLDLPDTTEFHSVWPVSNTPFKSNCNLSTSSLSNGEFDLSETDDDSSDINLAPEDIAFNTNARNHQTRDRLRQIFADRHSHKSLSEQKVSDWLLRYRSYAHCSPKDLTDIPESIWAPLDIGPSSKPANGPDSDVMDLQGHNATSIKKKRAKKTRKNAKRGDSQEQAAPVPPMIKQNTSPKKRHHSITPGHVQPLKSTTGKFQVPYFFQPPYKQVQKVPKGARQKIKLEPLRKAEKYMDLSKGLIRASRALD